MSYLTRSEAETMEFAAALAGMLNAGDTVLLEGDLGTGKSVVARGTGAGHCWSDAQSHVYAADSL